MQNAGHSGPMALSPHLAESLAMVAAMAEASAEPWWIIGSAAVVLHGGKLAEVKDVDLMMSARDADAFLRRVGVEPRRGTGDERFRSRVFGTWDKPPIPVIFKSAPDIGVPTTAESAAAVMKSATVLERWAVGYQYVRYRIMPGKNPASRGAPWATNPTGGRTSGLSDTNDSRAPGRAMRQRSPSRPRRSVIGTRKSVTRLRICCRPSVRKIVRSISCRIIKAVKTCSKRAMSRPCTSTSL